MTGLSSERFVLGVQAIAVSSSQRIQVVSSLS